MPPPLAGNEGVGVDVETADVEDCIAIVASDDSEPTSSSTTGAPANGAALGATLFDPVAIRECTSLTMGIAR